MEMEEFIQVSTVSKTVCLYKTMATFLIGVQYVDLCIYIIHSSSCYGELYLIA